LGGFSVTSPCPFVLSAWSSTTTTKHSRAGS
jgi:hypothetical protein